MLTTEQTTETMANTVTSTVTMPSRWFLAGHYFIKGIAGILIANGWAAYMDGFGWRSNDPTGAAILVLAGVYLWVNTKKKKPDLIYQMDEKHMGGEDWTGFDDLPEPPKKNDHA
jgi:hypothetical protein